MEALKPNYHMLFGFHQITEDSLSSGAFALYGTVWPVLRMGHEWSLSTYSTLGGTKIFMHPKREKTSTLWTWTPTNRLEPSLSLF